MELATFNPGSGKDDSLSAVIRRYLIDIILDAARNSERALQVSIGPSEIGLDCERRLAMTLMHEPKVPGTGGDPWPSIVGTAGHAWLDKAFQRANQKLGYIRWLTEATVPVSGSIKGHVDLYDILLQLVLDHKLVGVDKMREYRRNGPSSQYRVQAHTYGKGFKNLGLPVKDVAIAFYSRGGLILPEKTGLYVWTEPFNETVADTALARLDVLTQCTVDLDVENHPERYALIPKTPGHDCTYCPYFKPAKVDEGVTCPGFMDDKKVGYV
jgi:hypothetical protein